MRVVLLLFIVACSCLAGFTQPPKPKIGLVLSGGGAKGIAQIRVLQVLDSLGIVPDYIAGTSMGSVVGALYASGYSGNQIDSIAKNIPWTTLFSNTVTFREINIEEKDEYGRYVYELPLQGLKPQFPLGVVEGQHIEEMLARLFFPVNTITQFDDLPIPFLCVAADIVKGEPVVLRSGSLAAAVRASMSIPTVFAPVRVGERLLVDGGVYMNLPVTYCREMGGADFIIAVDVGGGLLKEEELTSAISLLLQTTFLSGNLSYEKEKEKSDLFIDVVKHLKYGTMDFEHGAEMMQAGELAVREVMPELVSLAERLKPYPKRKVTGIADQPNRYALQETELDGVSERNENLVRARFMWRPGATVTRDQVGDGVHRLLGTRLFNKITYTIEGDSVRSVLTVRGKEKPSNAVKFAIHYDTDRGAGLILNFTKRNAVLPASRTVATLDLAENPRARFNYYYFLGKELKWWHFTEVYGERVLLNSFINGVAVPDVINRHVSVSSVLNRTINRQQYWGIGAVWQSSQLKPKVDPRDELSPESLAIIKYNLNQVGAKIHYQVNSLDKVYFPSKGLWFRAEGKVNFDNPFLADLLITQDTVRTESNARGEVQPYARINARFLQNITIDQSKTLQFLGQAGLTWEMFADSEKFSAYTLGAGDYLSIGGQIHRPRYNSFTFVGLREGEVAVPQVITMGAQLQWALSKSLYVLPAVNLLAAGYEAATFWKTLGNFDFASQRTDTAFYHVGYGVALGYMSMIGPIQVAVSNDAQINKVRWFLNIGFNL